MNSREVVSILLLCCLSSFLVGYSGDKNSNVKPLPSASCIDSEEAWKKVVVNNLCLLTSINKFSAQLTANKMFEDEKCKKDIAAVVAFVQANKEKNKLDRHTAFFKNASQFHACQEERIHSYECSWLYQFSDVVADVLKGGHRIDN